MTSNVDVAFVVMPFASVHRPAIGVSLLKSGLKNVKITSKVYYFNLKFAETIGHTFYDYVSEQGFTKVSLLGELLFSPFVFGYEPHTKKSIKIILQKILKNKSKEDLNYISTEFLKVQNQIPNFLKDCIDEVITKKPKLIGFTSVFQQHCASLAMAKVLKSKINIPVILGGANCENEMGAVTLKHAPWIDYVCSGEGDIAFAKFVISYLKNKSVEKIDGIITRNSTELEVALTNPVMNMDDLPIPEYDDYFNSLQKYSIGDNLSYDLVAETSRGCWWGEVSHCTFCGLNGSTMKYRSKSVNRVLEELKYLQNRYGVKTFSMVDNIMDLKYINNLFLKINSKGENLDLFYETKSNLSKKQLMMMKQGGVNRIQPGIESISDIVLKLMKKGVSALQNIQLLKWCVD